MDSVGVDDQTTTAALTALTDHLQRSVKSFLGLQLTQPGPHVTVTVTAFDPHVQCCDVATSMQLPLSLLGVLGTDQASTISFYASNPGAFVDLAADLRYALERTNGTTRPHLTLPDTRTAIVLDDPVQPTSTTSGIVGIAELSTISRAAGALVVDGYLLEEAETELARRAAVAGVTVLAYATNLVG